jgi:hypothetical protein
MTKALLALGAAAVALSAAPADAKHYTNQTECARWHNHKCVDWHRMTRAEARRAAQYRVGYAFGPSYAYTDYGALPQPIVTRYKLRRDLRYVNQNGYVYVVNPHNYRVERVISTY